MRTTATATAIAIASVVLAGCATRDTAPAATVVRARAPIKYEETVNTFFDITIADAQPNRRLVFGAPEPSPCLLSGGGNHLGWMVPVIYGTSPPAGAAKAASAPAPGLRRPALAGTTSTATASGTPPLVSLERVQIEGIQYFFWFNNETINAVTRRRDGCP
ncbi:MAG: hypothetical protein E6H58_20345 [Betaproteobacteria bacterium]|nr:MAG: hypothetical protein E6H65_12005 [Betaproteobacteria bacterium]TMH26966.1 MAG: hypothetical protein E6H58_20345 [Betaproteobacteria bacterium]